MTTFAKYALHKFLFICVAQCLPFLNCASEIARYDLRNIIADVHDYYGTSCVFLLHNDYGDMGELKLLQEMLSSLSSMPVFSVTMDLSSLNTSAEFYYTRVVRPLFFVDLLTDDNVKQFSKLSEKFKMAFPVWFLFFAEDTYHRNVAKIHGKNTFHLNFDTEMLVMKRNASVIEEWYGLANKVRVLPLANWSPDIGLRVQSKGSLYQRRSNLEGISLVVTTVDNPPMITYENSSISGLFGTIVKELARVNNFNVKYLLPKEMAYGRWNEETGKWNGMMELLVSGRATIGAAEFRMTTSRFDDVDFTLPLISTRDQLYIRQPESGILWSGYLQALSPGIWGVIGSLILMTTILLTLITAVKGYKINYNVVSEYFLLVLGIYCQQGLADFPESLPLRIAYFSVFVSALVVSAGYSASLISYLTVMSSELPFSTLEGFANDGTYELIVFRASAEYEMFSTSTDETLAKMWNLMRQESSLPVTLKDGFRQVCEEKVGFYTQAALKDTISLYMPCKVVTIDTQLSISLGMAISKNSPYFGLINYQIQRFQDTGIMNRLKHLHAVTTNPPETTHEQVTLWGVTPILAVLAVGIVLAVISLLIERSCLPKDNAAKAKQDRAQVVKFNRSPPSSDFNESNKYLQTRFHYYLP